jgi:hypothetical protein
LKREIKEIKKDAISAYLSKLTNDNNTDYSVWKATKKKLKDLLCIFPQSGKQMESGPETVNKKRNDLLNT